MKQIVLTFRKRSCFVVLHDSLLPSILEVQLMAGFRKSCWCFLCSCLGYAVHDIRDVEKNSLAGCDEEKNRNNCARIWCCPMLLGWVTLFSRLSRKRLSRVGRKFHLLKQVLVLFVSSVLSLRLMMQSNWITFHHVMIKIRKHYRIDSLHFPGGNPRRAFQSSFNFKSSLAPNNHDIVLNTISRALRKSLLGRRAHNRRSRHLERIYWTTEDVFCYSSEARPKAKEQFLATNTKRKSQ